MFELARELLRDFGFLLKLEKLIIACVCLHELSKYSEYMIPRWLWVIYCIDSSTYSIIYILLAMAHVFEKPRKLPEFTYFSLGVIFHLTGGIAGVVRGQNEPSEPNRSEIKIGLLLIANFAVLFCETAYIIYLEIRKRRQANASPVTPTNVQQTDE